ncbi:MAG: acyl-CoA dehydrogenase family protein [Chloroflexi bacterium]|nr:acyl-CoA dehydrogenase family protein [Chloroflexota bacterium]
MDFDLTEGQLAIQRLARQFAENEVAPRVTEYDREEYYPVELVHKMGKLGFTGGTLPPKYGGSGMDHLSLVLVSEEIGRFCNYTASLASAPSCSAGQGILTYGTEEQKVRYLAPMARGETVAATGVTEPHSGTDIVQRMETTVVKDGDDYIITGAKTWIGGAGIADWLITFATMDKSAGHRGVCAFVVERNWPGVEVSLFKNKMGSRPRMAGRVDFKQVRVPRENLVGREREGYKVLMCGTEIGRLACAARALGGIRACLDDSVRYAQQRTTFGQPIGRYQLVQLKITQMVVGLDAARLLTYRLAWQKDKGMERVQKEASIAKMFATDTYAKAAADAVQIHGAAGIDGEAAVGRHYRDAKAFQIVDGTNDIHVAMIAEHVLGYR